ncbi:MAG: nitroreductase family protein [Candidatus Hodarchaeota archaeon]
MEFSKPITKIIEERTSWRTYNDQSLDNKMRNKIIQILKLEGINSPFKNYAGNCRFELVNVPEFDPHERRKIGTYGMIAGAQEFIVGVCDKTKNDFGRENYGYLLELIILAATDMGLGTCWLGGFFNRDLFSSKVNCGSNEEIPAITPIGYPKDRRFKEKLIRRAVKAKSRRSWENLFFQNNFNTPINKQEIGRYATLLEMVRLGPSAGNRQPWRIIKEENNNVFHFYVANPEGKIGSMYRKFVPLDIGIAVCHFDLCASQFDIGGKWVFKQPMIDRAEGMKYIISWTET